MQDDPKMGKHILLFLFVLVSRHELASFSVEMFNTTLTNETSITTNPQETEELTIDDFIQVNLNEFSKLFSNYPLTYGGRFNKKIWYVDKNNTKYLIIPTTIDDWRKAAENATDGDLICVNRECKTAEEVISMVRDSDAISSGWIRASQVPYFAVMASCFILIEIVGVTGNGLILTAVTRSKAVRNSTNVLMCSLAASDILVLTICLPMLINDRFFYTYYIFPTSVCKLWTFFRYFSIPVSVFTMTVMAVERYIAVCHPLKAKSYCTVPNARIAVAVVWVFSISLSLPVVFFTGEDSATTRCALYKIRTEDQVIFYACVAMLVLFFPLLIMGPLYLKICLVLWKSAQNSSKMEGSTEKEETDRGKARKQVIKMLIIVLVVFITCWGPVVLYDLFSMVRYTITRNARYVRIPAVSGTLGSLAISNSCLNPIVYASMSSQFQIYVKSLLKCSKKPDGNPADDSTRAIDSQKTASDSI